MNARFYDSNSGRFLTQDTYTGNAWDPMSQNLYSYVGNNPTNYTDPTGHYPAPLQLIDGGKGSKSETSWWLLKRQQIREQNPVREIDGGNQYEDASSSNEWDNISPDDNWEFRNNYSDFYNEYQLLFGRQGLLGGLSRSAARVAYSMAGKGRS